MDNYFTLNDMIRFDKQMCRKQSESPYIFPKKESAGLIRLRERGADNG